MKPGRMYLSQGRLNTTIAYVILVDVALGYLLKAFRGPYTKGPLGLLYLLNLAVLLGVYRFWKSPLFEWDETGFAFLGVAPWKKDAGLWARVEKAGFKAVPDRKGRPREHFIIVFTDTRGIGKTGAVPMDSVGFREQITKEMQTFLKRKGVRPL